MSAPKRPKVIAETEYLAMADASPVAALDARGCRGFDSDQRVQLGEYVYPDSIYVCGEPGFDGIALLNPTLIVEVLSPGTERRDRRE